DWEKDRKIRHDRTVAEFNNDLDQANTHLKGGKFDEARIAIARARLELNNNRDVFSETELENSNKTANDALANVDKAQQAAIERAAKQRADEAAVNARKTDEEARKARDQKIVQLIDRARAYQSEKRYTEALQAVEQLLFLDPINPTGLLL